MPGPKAETSFATGEPMPADEFSQVLSAARQAIESGGLTAAQARQVASLAVSQFWACYLTDGSYTPDAIRLLCEIVVHADPGIARAGQHTLFTALVEPLSDAFDPAFCELYDHTFAQIIDCCRRQPTGKALDDTLRRFGLYSIQDILQRRRRLEESVVRCQVSPERARKVFLPSRVTLGAEVAITATLLARIRNVFHHAQCVLLAAPAIRQIFAEDERITIREVRYSRAQGLIEQLGSWLEMLHIIREETEGLAPDEFLVVDPDSRLTQLGLLPVVEDHSRYLFFPSRSIGEDEPESIGALADRWASQVFGGPARLYPTLSLPHTDRDFAKSLCQHMRNAGASCLVVMNFGVGGNLEKRLPEEFEFQLVRRLIENGSTIVLAKGIGEEEIARSERLLAQLTSSGEVTRELDTTQTLAVPASEALRCAVLAWQGQVGTYCALIENSDEYIGYDSGGQHIAAALGTPTIDIFAHSPYPRFMQRWRPYGPGSVCVVDATQSGRAQLHDLDSTIEQILDCHRTNRRDLPTLIDAPK